jgi:hypothetical protein
MIVYRVDALFRWFFMTIIYKITTTSPEAERKEAWQS